MDDIKNIKKAFFACLIMEDLPELVNMDFEDLMGILYGFFYMNADYYAELFSSIVDYGYDNENCIICEDKNDIDKVKGYILQIRNGDTSLIDSIDDQDDELITMLAELFVSYYRLYVNADEPTKLLLKRQALFYYCIILGVSDPKEEGCSGPLNLDTFSSNITYYKLKDDLKIFLAEYYLKAIRRGKEPKGFYKIQGVLPHTCKDGVIELVSSDYWDKMVIEYLDDMLNSKPSIFDDIDVNDRNYISKLAAMFLKVFFKILGKKYIDNTGKVRRHVREDDGSNGKYVS